MHVREGLEDLAALVLGPHHERVHRPFNVGLIAVPSSSFPEDSRFCRSSASCWPTIIGLGFICRTIYLLGPCGAKSRNRKRERGKTRIKWQARGSDSFVAAAIIIRNCFACVLEPITINHPSIQFGTGVRPRGHWVRQLDMSPVSPTQV